jgi:mRNA interferase HigB
MKKRYTEEQIIGFLREADAGLPVKELCRKHGFSEPSYYAWKAKFGGMNVSDAQRLKALDAEQPLKAWYEEAKSAAWTQPAEIKAQYRNASVLKNRRVVFNIKGNEYRLIVAVAYRLQIVYVQFVGTHKEYDAVDAETIESA